MPDLTRDTCEGIGGPPRTLTASLHAMKGIAHRPPRSEPATSPSSPESSPASPSGGSPSELGPRSRRSPRSSRGPGSPTVRTLLRIAGSAGYELVLGLIGADEDPLLPDELDAFALLGVLRPNEEDGLADFVVLREPSVFDGPHDDDTG